MKGIEGVSSGGSIERKKRVEAWHKLLASGELIDVQKKILDELSLQIKSSDTLNLEFEAYQQNLEVQPEQLTEIPTFSQGRLSTRQNHFQQITTARSPGINSKLRCTSLSESLEPSELKLFQAFDLLYEKVKRILSQESISLSPEMQSVYNLSTELASPQKIALDNVQTYFDIFRFVTREVPEENHMEIINRLLSERPDYKFQTSEGNAVDLNPYHETDLELLTKAPFAFWATTRYDVPLKIDDEPILNISNADDPLFSASFIGLLTRGQIQVSRAEEDTPASLLRHGGCPVLHKDFKAEELISKSGKVFADFYSVLNSAR